VKYKDTFFHSNLFKFNHIKNYFKQKLKFASASVLQVTIKDSHPITCYEGTEGELGYIYVYTLPLTSAIYWLGDQRHIPTALQAGKRKVIQFIGCCVAPAPICWIAENFSSPAFDPRIVQPVESRYTDCAIAGYQITIKAVKI
jgi:hypothetical protein